MSRSFFKPCQLRWAAPSWVMPGSVAANAEFLALRVPAISLCFYETAACLQYQAADLPPAEFAPGLTWILHLPLDLPWDADVHRAVIPCLALYEKVVHLRPTLAVLHPPAMEDATALLGQFAQLWDAPLPIALENTADCDVLSLGRTFLTDNNFHFCLDVAHAFSFGQWRLLASGLVAEAIIWHWSAPGGGDRHHPLTKLDTAEKKKARELLSQARTDSIHLLEIFHWPGIRESLPVLAELAEC